MRHLLNHTHEPGRHCASTSVADLLRYHGIPDTRGVESALTDVIDSERRYVANAVQLAL